MLQLPSSANDRRAAAAVTAAQEFTVNVSLLAKKPKIRKAQRVLLTGLLGTAADDVIDAICNFYPNSFFPSFSLSILFLNNN